MQGLGTKEYTCHRLKPKSIPARQSRPRITTNSCKALSLISRIFSPKRTCPSHQPHRLCFHWEPLQGPRDAGKEQPRSQRAQHDTPVMALPAGPWTTPPADPCSEPGLPASRGRLTTRLARLLALTPRPLTPPALQESRPSLTSFPISLFNIWFFSATYRRAAVSHLDASHPMSPPAAAACSAPPTVNSAGNQLPPQPHPRALKPSLTCPGPATLEQTAREGPERPAGAERGVALSRLPWPVSLSPGFPFRRSALPQGPFSSPTGPLAQRDESFLSPPAQTSAFTPTLTPENTLLRVGNLLKLAGGKCGLDGHTAPCSQPCSLHPSPP